MILTTPTPYSHHLLLLLSSSTIPWTFHIKAAAAALEFPQTLPTHKPAAAAAAAAVNWLSSEGTGSSSSEDEGEDEDEDEAVSSEDEVVMEDYEEYPSSSSAQHAQQEEGRRPLHTLKKLYDMLDDSDYVTSTSSSKSKSKYKSSSVGSSRGYDRGNSSLSGSGSGLEEGKEEDYSIENASHHDNDKGINENRKTLTNNPESTDANTRGNENVITPATKNHHSIVRPLWTSEDRRKYKRTQRRTALYSKAVTASTKGTHPMDHSSDDSESSSSSMPVYTLPNLPVYLSEENEEDEDAMSSSNMEEEEDDEKVEDDSSIVMTNDNVEKHNSLQPVHLSSGNSPPPQQGQSPPYEYTSQYHSNIRYHHHQQQQQQQQQQGEVNGEGPFVYSSEKVDWNQYNSTTTNDVLRYEHERGGFQPQQDYFEQQSKPQRDPRLYPQNYWTGAHHHHHQVKQTIPYEDKPSKEMFPTLRVLGKGSFGKVVLVQKRSGMTDVGSLFALKILRKQRLLKRRQVERLKTERAVLTLANNHPFIMKLHFAFQTSDKLFFVLDYCPGGELFFHLSRFRRFPERVARFYAAEVLLAIGHLHSCRIVYRDLKPENILLDAKGHVKLGDFGLAKENISEPCRGANSLCGTPEYMAPEVIRQSGHGLVVDYWGLGMVIYEMITGLPPWYTTDRAKLFKRIKRAPLDIPDYFSNEASAMITSLLERNPYHRLGAVNGVADVMSHPFFYGTDWKETYNRELLPPIRPCEGWNPNGIFISNDGQLHATKPVHENDLDEMVSNFDEEITRGAIESRGHEDFQNQLSDSGLSDEEQLIIKKYPGFSYHKDEQRFLRLAGKYRQRPTQLHYATTRQAREAQQCDTLGYHHPENAYSHYTQPQQPQAFMNHPSTYFPSQQSYDQQRYSNYPNQSHQVYDHEAANINEQGTQTSVNLLNSKPDVKENRQVNTHHFRSKSLPARTFQTNLLISETANLALDDEEVREWDEKWDKDGTSENELHWDGNDTENDCLAGESIIPTNAADDEHVVNIKPPSANSSTHKLFNPPSNSNKISNPLLIKKNSIAAFTPNAAEHPIKLCLENKNEVTSLVRSQLSRGNSSIHSSDESNCSKASVLGRDMGDANFPSRS